MKPEQKAEVHVNVQVDVTDIGGRAPASVPASEHQEQPDATTAAPGLEDAGRFWKRIIRPESVFLKDTLAGRLIQAKPPVGGMYGTLAAQRGVTALQSISFPKADWSLEDIATWLRRNEANIKNIGGVARVKVSIPKSLVEKVLRR